MNRKRLLAIATLVGLMSSSVALAEGLIGDKERAAAIRKLIGEIILHQDEFDRAFQIGVESACYGVGARLLEAKTESNPEKEQSLVDAYISRGVNAIIISPVDAKASAPVLDRVAKTGIKVITYNSTIDGDGPSAFVESSQEQIGQTTGAAAAKFIKDNLSGKAKIGVLQFKSLSPEQSGARVGGFLGAVKTDGVDLVADRDAWQADKAAAVAGEIITANPDISILFAANEGATVGAVQAVRNAGKQGKIFVFGSDPSQELASFLVSDDDVLQAVTGQDNYLMGFKAVEAAIAAIDGKPLDKLIIVPLQVLDRNHQSAIRDFVEKLADYNDDCPNLESICVRSP
jgi:ABC-type sugar transport system substrate-binding protein